MDFSPSTPLRRHLFFIVEPLSKPVHRLSGLVINFMLIIITNPKRVRLRFILKTWQVLLFVVEPLSKPVHRLSGLESI